MKIVLAIVVLFLIGIGGCKVSSRNLAETKLNAPQFLAAQGFTVVGYQGYEYGLFSGGRAWYTMSKNNITYQAMVMNWYGELHLYYLKAIDAIKPE